MKNWSYSRYETWKKCPAILRFQQEATEKPPTPPAAQRGLDFHKAAELFILGETDELPELLEYYRAFFLTLRENGAEPEKKAAVDSNWKPVDFESPNRWWRGIRDCRLKMDSVIIFDWKTGNEYDNHRGQREVYAITDEDAEEGLDVKVMHVYFDKKLNSVSVFTPDDIQSLRKKWEENIEVMFNDTRLAPNPNWYCRSCAFSRDKGGPCAF